MHYELTDGARRAVLHAARWQSPEAPEQLTPPTLLVGLLAESECRAALILQRHGIDLAAICQQWPALKPLPGEQAAQRVTWLTEIGPLTNTGCTADVLASLAAIAHRLGQRVQPFPLATEHLLFGLAAADHSMALWLQQRGIDPDQLEDEIRQQYGLQFDPLPWDDESSDTLPPLAPEHPTPSEPPTPDAPLSAPAPGNPGEAGKLFDAAQQLRILRIIDAAANRAREGLRVVEDYVRFVLDDRHLTDQLKQLRHALTAALATVPVPDRLAARETQADVGTLLFTPSEYQRTDAAHILAANFARLQESLRSLEEYGKLLGLELAVRCEQIRYRTYTLQRAIEYTRSSVQRLADARLYVLLDGGSSLEQFQQTTQLLVTAGVHILQLRDKQLADRQLVQRGRILREITRQTNTLFILNDRPDLAVLCDADGVHVGQEELTVKDARTIVGPDRLVGLSTHSIAQARQGVLDGANYLGVGPVFPSGTKSFSQFPGLEFVQQVAQEIRLPAFAIGGITPENLPQVIAAGLRRVAVSSAIVQASAPAVVAQQMLRTLS